MATATVASLIATVGAQALRYAATAAEPSVHEYLAQKVDEIKNPAFKAFTSTLLQPIGTMIDKGTKHKLKKKR